MITIHAQDTTDFDNNGLGVLEPISCDFNVTINGVWSLELEHPLDDEKIYDNDGVNKIAKNNIIKITNPQIINEQTSPYQLFRIYDTVQTLSTIKAIAFPIALEATYDAIIEELKTDKKTATATLADIMTYLSNHGVTKYTVESDYTQDGVVPRQKKGSWASTNLIAAISGSDDGSIINHWGGEVVYDNYKIIVNGKLGTFGDAMSCNPAFRFTEAFWHSQTYDHPYPEQEQWNYRKYNDESAIIARDNSEMPNFMLVSNVSANAVKWQYQKMGYDYEEQAWHYGEWTAPNVGDVYHLNIPCSQSASFQYKGKTWWVSWGYLGRYNSSPFQVISDFVLNGRQSTGGDIVGNAKLLIDYAGWNPKTPDKYECRVGKNIAGLSVDTDISGVATRLYPVSEDNVRLKTTVDNTEISYVDSSHRLDYPYTRSAFIKAPFKLVDTTWEGTVHTDTQIATHDAIDELTEAVEGVASQLWTALNGGNTWHNKWYEPEWVKSIMNDTIAQCQKDLTANIAHPTWKSVIQSCIKNGLNYIKDQDIPDFYWELVTGSTDVYCYTNGLRTIKDQYYYVDKKFCHFNEAGNYEPWEDISSMDWIQPKGSSAKKKYGDNQRYYARDTYVYIYNQAGDKFCEYWFDDDGYWDNVSETETDWDWHDEGSYWWFGESGATESDKSKYAHDCWLWINKGTAGLYYFDSKGHLDSSLTKNAGWSWQEIKSNGLDSNAGKYYFGSTNKNQYKVQIESQWLKVDGEWRKFKDDGTLTDMKVLKNQFINLLSTNLASAIASTITYHQNYLYDLLYTEMIQYCMELYEDGLDTPVINVTADIVELSKMRGYEDFAKFEQIHLGNDVDVHDYVHNFHRTERIVGLKYDCIRGYNTEVTIGAKSVFWESMKMSVGNSAQTGKKVETIEMGKKDTNRYEVLTAGVGINIDANGVISADNIVGDVFGGTEVAYDPNITTGQLLGTIYINGSGYGIYAEEGGSDVSITPSLQSGTKVADYEIDGVNGSLYAPTPTTYTAGENVSISNGVISATDTTYNDFAGSSHGLVPAVSTQQGKFLKDDGTWATPSGGGGGASALNDLSDVSLSSPSNGQILKFNSTSQEWENAEESGGTDVEANPSGSPTDVLTALKIDNTIYSIPSGGGGSGGVDLSQYANWWHISTTNTKTNVSINDGDTYKGSFYIQKRDYTTSAMDITQAEWVFQGMLIYGKDAFDNTYPLFTSANTIQENTSVITIGFDLKNTSGVQIVELEILCRWVIPKAGSGGASDLEDLGNVDITTPSDGQVLKYDATNDKWINANESGGGGGSTITYGTTDPSGSANDGDVYYVLKDGKLRGTYLYITNQWVLIDGSSASTLHEGLHIWTHSTGGYDASMYIQHGYYDEDTGTFIYDQSAVSIPYQDVYNKETTYYDFVSLLYTNQWKCTAKTGLTDGAHTYQIDDIIKTWAYNSTVDFTVWIPA